MNQALVLTAVKRELTHYPGVEMKHESRGKHDRLAFSHGDQTRFLTIPRSPSDWRADKNAVRDFKKTMEELGVQRSGMEARRKWTRRKRGADATISLNGTKFSVNIGADSKLIGRFKTADGKAAGHWTVELRPSPDLEAPPMIALKAVQLPPGHQVQHGVTCGFGNPQTGAWRLLWARGQVKALTKRIKALRRVPATLYEDNGGELVFKLPPGVIPTGFRKHDEQTPLPSVAFTPKPEPEAEPQEAPAPAEPTTGPKDQPMILQFPKQTVSVEQAIAILNKAKRRLGGNLRFSIVEDGYLTAVHRIGY